VGKRDGIYNLMFETECERNWINRAVGKRDGIYNLAFERWDIKIRLRDGIFAAINEREVLHRAMC